MRLFISISLSVYTYTTLYSAQFNEFFKDVLMVRLLLVGRCLHLKSISKYWGEWSGVGRNLEYPYSQPYEQVSQRQDLNKGLITEDVRNEPPHLCASRKKCWPYEIFKREKRWGTGRSICLQQDVNKRFIYVLVECVARCYSASTDAVDRCRVFSWRPQASSRLVPWCSWQQVTFLTKFNKIT